MATAIVFGPPGAGKTCNSTLVPGKTLLLSTDNSSIVLKHFDRPDLTIKEAKDFSEYIRLFDDATTSKQYDTVITDCLTDIIDAFIVECRESGKFQDIRQAYMLAYTKIKSLVRRAAHCGTNCIFCCWEDADEFSLPSGEVTTRLSPMLPAKIKQQVCGLCNVIAYVTTAVDKEGKKRWYYVTEGTPTMMCKDQIACRKNCMPENIFNIKEDK